jgi:hypothetical protein
MSKQHHHSNEGQSEGNPPYSAWNHLHHNWFFYLSNLILIALIAFVLSGNFSWQFSATPSSQAPLVGSSK